MVDACMLCAGQKLATAQALVDRLSANHIWQEEALHFQRFAQDRPRWLRSKLDAQRLCWCDMHHGAPSYDEVFVAWLLSCVTTTLHVRTSLLCHAPSALWSKHNVSMGCKCHTIALIVLHRSLSSCTPAEHETSKPVWHVHDLAAPVHHLCMQPKC